MIREDKDQMEKIRVGLSLKEKDHNVTLPANTQLSLSSPQKIGAELQGRVHGDFQALHHFLRVEEEAMMEELKREQEELLQGLERHLEALQVAIRDVEQNINTLRQTASCADQSVLVEVIIMMLSICNAAAAYPFVKELIFVILMSYLRKKPECWLSK